VNSGQFSWGDVLEILVALVAAGVLRGAWEVIMQRYWRSVRLRQWEKMRRDGDD